MDDKKDNSSSEKPAVKLKAWEKPKLVVLDVTPSTQGKILVAASEINMNYGLS